MDGKENKLIEKKQKAQNNFKDIEYVQLFSKQYEKKSVLLLVINKTD